MELTSPGARRGVRETPGKCAHTDGVSRSPPNAVSSNDALAAPWRVLDRLKTNSTRCLQPPLPTCKRSVLCAGDLEAIAPSTGPPPHPLTLKLMHSLMQSLECMKIQVKT